jgi:diguanylate cyclase (GGDEF)-like protein
LPTVTVHGSPLSHAATTLAETATLAAATRLVIERCAAFLQVPVALLSHGTEGWRYEGDEVPSRPPEGVENAFVVRAPDGRIDHRTWTGIVIGVVGDREWMLMVPGASDEWRGVPDLEAFVDRIRGSLERVTLEDTERRHRRLARQVYAFSRRLARSGPGPTPQAFILRTMARAVKARTGSIALYNRDEEAFTVCATLGYPLAIVEHVVVTPGHGILGQAVVSRKPIVATVPEASRRLRYHADTYLLQPLLYKNQTLGVVALTDKDGGQAFNAEDLTVVRSLAAPAALALSRESMHQSIQELTRAATVDSVTGLYNRRYFEDRLQAELQRARRQQQSLALLMVDIDDFKRINDTFGHQAGDRALKEVAELLRSGVRIFDDCARYGGEEFTILMPGATAEMAVQAAERVRRRIEESSRRDNLTITVSVGVAMLGDGETSDDLIGAADGALSAAKQAGKNRVQMNR